MSFFLSALLAISSSLPYTRFPTEISEVKIEGYPTFKYAFWLHPYQQKGHELASYFNKKSFDSISRLPQDSVVIDIGAHSGDTAVAYANALGSRCSVLAFEPCDLIYEILKENAELNKNIIPLNYAITESEGEYDFVYTDIGCCNGGFSTVLADQGVYFGQKIPFKVKGVNLEKFLFENYPDHIPNISFIKIDTEGYDMYILQSIKNLLKKINPIIQVEIYPTLTINEKKLFHSIIKDLGYDIYLGGLESYSLASEKINEEAFLNLGFCDCTLVKS